jgi:hypothetical protein
MQQGRSPSTAAAAEQASVDSLLGTVERLGRESIEEKDYYREVLVLLLRDGPFDAVAVWSIDEAGAMLKACAPASVTFSELPERSLGHLFSGQAIEVDRGDSGANGSGPSATRSIVAGSRIHETEGIAVEGVLKHAASSQRDMRLLEAVAELVGHVETRFRYLAARSRAGVSQDVERVLRSFHQGRTLRETSLLIASGFQETLGCDRSWVCRVSKGRARVVSSSAPGDVARRQLLVKRVEDAANAGIAHGGRMIWAAGDATLPGVQEVLALADEGRARRIVVLPLIRTDSQAAVGAMVLEQFSEIASPDEQARCETLVPHAALALDRAIEIDRGWQSRLADGASGSRWMRGAALLAALAILVFLAVPIPFEVEAEGQLLPATIRSVFAPADGVVTSIHVRHGEAVKADASLLTLRSPELDLERERVAGQISELNAKLAAIQVLRTQGRPTANESSGDLSAQEEQVHVALKGATEQRRLLDEQTARLELHSPIGGVVDRWDLDEALMSRPVVRGQHLCDVLDVDGAWKLDLRIPDKASGVVLGARADASNLPIRFVVRTDPQTEYPTALERVGERTEVDEAGRLYVRGTAAIDSGLTVGRRAGASVVARIDCGRRSRAYVWFHELWDSLALQFL